MSKSMKIFLNILSWCGIAVWSLIVLIGVHYAYGCSWAVSIPAGIVCALLMGFLLYAAKYFSHPKESNDFSAGGVVKKWLFFGLYCAVSLISAWWLLHAVAVATVLKEQVRPAAQVQIAELRTMVSPETGAGATKGSYMEYVETRLSNFRNYNPNNRHDSSELDADLRNLRDLLVTNSGYPNLAREITDFGERADYAIDNWDLLTVGSYVDEMARKKPEWEKKLVECGKKADIDEFESLHVEYAPLATHNTALAEPLFRPSASNITGVGIVLILLLQIVILLNWIADLRDKVSAPRGLGAGNPFITTWNQNSDNRK